MAENVMTDAHLTSGEIEAGADYLRALRRLKFEPEVMCWTFVTSQSFEPDIHSEFTDLRKELAIVTSLVDYAGPKALYDLLFQAYDASLLPQEIDPFLVTLYSPLTSGGRLLTQNVTASSVKDNLMRARQDNPTVKNINQAVFDLPSLMHLTIILDGVYVAQKALPATKSQKKYQTFKDEVLRRAA